jgi:hypothetical protein
VKIKDPNPLDVLDLRRVDYCPPHFSTANVVKRYNLENAICEWIEHHLKGRYYFGSNVELNKTNNTIEGNYTVGFENAKELSYFMLACPHLKYN